MAKRQFFGKHFIGMNVTFVEPRPSTWTLVRKVNEKYNQMGELDLEEFDDPVSDAWAMFTCQNADNPSEEARMRIYMQIPHEGSEFELSEARASQASENVGEYAQSECDALQRFTERRCSSMPHLLGYKKDRQPANAPVPGGYIFYLLMTELPGIRLGTHSIFNAPFWKLPDDTRDRIRREFQVAYGYVSNS